jgi:colicin import membrane protein
VNLPVASELTPRKERLWPAALVSVALHATLITWAMLRTSGPEIDLDQKPIVARLVRLGEKRPEQLLPRKEEPPPAATAPVIAAPSAAVAAAAPPSAPVPGAKPVPPSAKPPPGPATTAERASRIASLLSSQRQRTSTASEPVYGDPNGDPLGDSSEGEGDQYAARVRRTLQENYDVPTTISEKERLFLSADVVLQIDQDGKLVRWKIVRPSDNPLFNTALERTLRLTPRLPPPPLAERDRYRSGVTVQFKI